MIPIQCLPIIPSKQATVARKTIAVPPPPLPSCRTTARVTLIIIWMEYGLTETHSHSPQANNLQEASSRAYCLWNSKDAPQTSQPPPPPPPATEYSATTRDIGRPGELHSIFRCRFYRFIITIIKARGRRQWTGNLWQTSSHSGSNWTHTLSIHRTTTTITLHCLSPNRESIIIPAFRFALINDGRGRSWNSLQPSQSDRTITERVQSI